MIAPRSSLAARLLCSLALAIPFAACGSDPDETPAAPATTGPNDVIPGGDASTDVSVSPDAAQGDTGPQLPPPKDCYDALTQKGIQFEKTQARGVVDAVHVKSPLAGIPFTNGDQDEMMQDPIACEFVLTLEKLAQILKTKGVVKVGTLGSYCYRCCCAWSPTNDCRTLTDPEPDCGSNGYSTHSWGRAVDIEFLHMAGGQVYDIEKPTQWVAGSSQTTCSSGLAAQQGVSKFLYQTVCDVAEAHIFATILTPNYNDAHRNHWHMDIGEKGPVTGGTVVRDIHPTYLDIGDFPDRCGGH